MNTEIEAGVEIDIFSQTSKKTRRKLPESGKAENLALINKTQLQLLVKCLLSCVACTYTSFVYICIKVIDLVLRGGSKSQIYRPAYRSQFLEYYFQTIRG